MQPHSAAELVLPAQHRIPAVSGAGCRRRSCHLGRRQIKRCILVLGRQPGTYLRLAWCNLGLTRMMPGTPCISPHSASGSCGKMSGTVMLHTLLPLGSSHLRLGI